eukprot:TRINITY_DN13981_c0_g1_i1.p1 TRINITY_DN13981_c0_g1~~TRINITY_DN13981_c0_g1_i1.p1  ORF type:complete len:289 (+),score=124.04 TRINITY_DN13981_c0_g1_i1:90-869(+)
MWEPQPGKICMGYYEPYDVTDELEKASLSGWYLCKVVKPLCPAEEYRVVWQDLDDSIPWRTYSVGLTKEQLRPVSEEMGRRPGKEPAPLFQIGVEPRKKRCRKEKQVEEEESAEVDEAEVKEKKVGGKDKQPQQQQLDEGGAGKSDAAESKLRGKAGKMKSKQQAKRRQAKMRAKNSAKKVRSLASKKRTFTKPRLGETFVVQMEKIVPKMQGALTSISAGLLKGEPVTKHLKSFDSFYSQLADRKRRLDKYRTDIKKS